MEPGPDVVLVDRSHRPMSTAHLAQVARALQTQVDRDFGMVWGGRARVIHAYDGNVPTGAWSIAVAGDPAAPLGIALDGDRIPRATVRSGAGWTLAASHVLLEMLANPDGGRFIDGLDITPRAPQRRVRYLVEVCDPCQLSHYRIDGVQVSDFVTPDFYRADAAPGTAFDFLRHVRRPLAVARGGCLSWQDPDDRRWHERRPDGGYSISGVEVDGGDSPRADRDGAFPEGSDRHDVAAVRRGQTPRRERGARAG